MSEHLCNAAGYFPGRRDVQELIWSVCIRLWSQYSCYQELGMGKLITQHAHERNGDTFARIHRCRAKIIL